MWRTASFRCRCHDNNTSINNDHFGLRTFCTTCTYPVFQPISTQRELCPVCTKNETWQQYNSPCIACRFAAIVYQQSFQTRFDKQVEFWLKDTLSDSSETDQQPCPRQDTHRAAQTNSSTADIVWMQRRLRTIENNFKEMKKLATPAQTRIIFRDLSVVQQTIRQSINQINTGDSNKLYTQSDSMNRTVSHSEPHCCWFSPMQFESSTTGSNQNVAKIRQPSDQDDNSSRSRLPRLPFSKLDMNNFK
jgi:hypothetical protein